MAAGRDVDAGRCRGSPCYRALPRLRESVSVDGFLHPRCKPVLRIAWRDPRWTICAPVPVPVPVPVPAGRRCGCRHRTGAGARAGWSGARGAVAESHVCDGGRAPCTPVVRNCRATSSARQRAPSAARTVNGPQTGGAVGATERSGSPCSRWPGVLEGSAAEPAASSARGVRLPGHRPLHGRHLVRAPQLLPRDLYDSKNSKHLRAAGFSRPFSVSAQ